MSEIRFGRLEDLAPRVAWEHEERRFTPWLAENLSHLAEAIGIRLEHLGSEVLVERYRADLLARNSSDQSLVLIENQLEITDHTHLGQIMTYLAGLDAKTVVWVAPAFREPHLSAIRWLNEHTAEDFAFFAVRLRVVRIGDSPYAPIFEVVEKPNEWDRLLQTEAREVGEIGKISAFRRAFWTAYLDRHPEAKAYGVSVVAVSSNWINLSPELNVTLMISLNGADVAIRGPRGGDSSSTAAILAPLAERLEARLGTPSDQSGAPYFFLCGLRLDAVDEANWPKLIDFLHSRGQLYAGVLRDELALGEGA